MSKNVLIVDDEKILRFILVQEFLDEGYIVFEADGGNKAFEIIQNENIDVVLSDVRMPDGDGVELLKRIVGLDDVKPFVYLLSACCDYTKAELVALGAVDFFTKPFDTDFILKQVQEILS